MQKNYYWMHNQQMKEMTDAEREEHRRSKLSPAMIILDDALIAKTEDIKDARVLETSEKSKSEDDYDANEVAKATNEVKEQLSLRNVILGEIDELKNEEFLATEDGVAFMEWSATHKLFKMLEKQTKDDNISSMRTAYRYKQLAEKNEEDGDEVATSIGKFMSKLDFKDDTARDAFRDKLDTLASKKVRASAKALRKKEENYSHKSNAIFNELLLIQAG